jgi:hypothetical protein
VDAFSGKSHGEVTEQFADPVCVERCHRLHAGEFGSGEIDTVTCEGLGRGSARCLL